MDKTVQKIYGDRVRIRVCGLCWKGDALLLVNHYGLYNHDFWAPPGGGLEFGQLAAYNLEREFLEETGLIVIGGELQFVCEFVQPPLHAVELFFHVISMGGRLITGIDPEMGEKQQIIREVEYMSESEINNIPNSEKHGMLRIAKSVEKIRGLRGYLKI